ncbi:sorbosone dehydrogenase family protein [Promineifilum sp.]|uniref:PQQ-dependent sugar dehydrogenase n=1 Tax=Promineifilum sp. TaxID=2664178 RepID=UPI0035B4036D
MFSRRRLLVVTLLLVILAAGGAYLYRAFLSQINFAGSIGGGEQADVTASPDFSVNVFAAGLSGPRFIAFGPDGALYVAERGAGRIVVLSDANGDGRADETRVFAEELDRPHSVAFHNGAWYVGVPSGVVRLADDDGDGVAESRQVIIDDLPPGGVHSTRTVAFLPDGRMVVSVGSSCNACVEEDPRRAAIVAYDDATGAGERLFAAGLRNAVGLAIHPETGELWASNNGRDLMGDDTPPETIYIVRDGANYGWPTCHSGDIPDPDMGGPGACDGVEPPLAEMQAHTAPLGIAFYTGDTFPADYRGDLFIALHGSWNRREPVGYAVWRLPLDGDTPIGPAEPFAAGWLGASGAVDGRPAGVAVGPDGALYVSDDRGGFIYRIQYDSP